LREAVRMGLGIAVLPQWLIDEDIVSSRLVRVLPCWCAKDLPAHIVYSVNRNASLRTRVFIKFASNYMMAVLNAK